MFRRLATRLTASYVFAAIVLVLIVGSAVTAFALSTFGLASREAMDAVARTAPEVVRLAIARHGSLAAAAPDIAGQLARPGLHIVVFGIDKGRRHFLAATGPEGPDGRVMVIAGERPHPLGGNVPPSGDGLPPLPPGDGVGGFVPHEHVEGGPPNFRVTRREFERMSPFPLGLNAVLRLEPKGITVPGGRINIFPDPGPLGRAIRSFWIAMLPIGALVTALAWLLGRFITGQALRPLVETTAALNCFASGDFTPRPIVAADRNEIGELVGAYNGAVAQVSAAFEERRSAELQMRQFIADAGHELRTPLTVIMGFLDVLRKRASADPATSTKIYDTMLAESRRMRALIDKLIVLARLENPRAGELEVVDLDGVAQSVVAALQALSAKSRIALQAQPQVLVCGDENELHEAVSNLIENALKYAPLSPVEVKVGAEGERAIVSVTDHGPGLGPDDQEHVFDRFYRGQNRGESEGFGLGLAIARRAVERAGGVIELESRPGAGCRFTISLPLYQPGAQTAIAV